MTEAARKSAATAQEPERERAPGPLSAMAPEQESAQALERARVWVPVQAPQLQEPMPQPGSQYRRIQDRSPDHSRRSQRIRSIHRRNNWSSKSGTGPDF